MKETLTATAIDQAIAGQTKIKLVTVEKTESTQLLAKNYLAHHDNGGPVVFIANQQSGGYGQHGRHFYSPAESGLYMSLLLPPQEIRNLRKPGLLTTSTAVVVVNVLEKYFPQAEFSLKWVNDVFLGKKKVAGILTEAVYQLGNTTASIIIGIGINLTTGAFPGELATKAGSIGSPVNRNRLSADLLIALMTMLSDYSSGKYLEKYRQRCFLLGKPVTIKTANGIKKGIATDISRTGGLVMLDSNGHQILIHSGEVQKVEY